MIIDGKIGLKNDSVLKEYTKTGLKFENGSTLDADLVVFATGLGDYRDNVKKIIGEELGSELKQVWGLDGDNEAKGAWRDIGIDNLWYMTGNLAMCRYYSRHVALREFFPPFLLLAVMLTIVDGQKSKLRRKDYSRGGIRWRRRHKEVSMVSSKLMKDNVICNS